MSDARMSAVRRLVVREGLARGHHDRIVRSPEIGIGQAVERLAAGAAARTMQRGLQAGERTVEARTGIVARRRVDAVGQVVRVVGEPRELE